MTPASNTPASNLLAKLQEAKNAPVKSGFNVRINMERNYRSGLVAGRVVLPYLASHDPTTNDTTFAVPDCLGEDGVASTLADELEMEIAKAARATVNEGFTVKNILDRNYKNQIIAFDFSLPLEETIDPDGTSTFSAADSLTAA